MCNKMFGGEKIQKILARNGYASRRKIEVMIKAGRIKINNKIVVLGERIRNKSFQVDIDGNLFFI